MSKRNDNKDRHTMSTDTDFAKLNRLRVNAGKPELKSWKASKAALDAAIQKLVDAGHTDALPGANTDVPPVPVDDEVAAALAKTEEPPALADSDMAKNINNDKPKEEPKEKPKAKLARGLDTDSYARQSRLAVQMQREKEKKEEKAKRKAEKDAEPKKEKKGKKNKKLKLSKEDKKQIKDEAESRLPKGAVDPKKDPEKAARQKKHIEDKQKARADKPAKEKSGDTVTVAELCRELDIDPKVGRAKLRRYEGKPSYPATVKGERWTFPKKAAADLKAILKGSK